MTWLSRPALCAATAAAALGLAGCGGVVVDDLKMERLLTSGDFRVGPGFAVDSAVCPTNVDVAVGARFRCELVSAGGEMATVTVEIRDEEADVDFVSLKRGRKPGPRAGERRRTGLSGRIPLSAGRERGPNSRI